MTRFLAYTDVGEGSADLESRLSNIADYLGRYRASDGRPGVVNKNYPEVDVRRYGTFDPTASAATNSATAQQAIVDVAGGQGGLIELPRGTFICESDIISLVNHKSTWLKGQSGAWGYDQSTGATCLVFEEGNVGIDCYQPTPGAESSYNGIRNLRINGNNLLSAGLRISAANSVEDVAIDHCADKGFWIPNLANATNFKRITAFANTAGEGIGFCVQGASSTTHNIMGGNFRLNKVGSRVENGFNISWQHIDISGNAQEGLQLFKPINAGTLANIFLHNIWFEDNWVDGTGYQIVIDSELRDFSAGPAAGITFYLVNINAIGSQKHLNIESAIDVDLIRTSMAGGDTANGFHIGSFGSGVYGLGNNLLTPVSGWGNRGGRRSKSLSGPDGYVSTMAETASQFIAAGGATPSVNTSAMTAVSVANNATTVLFPAAVATSGRLTIRETLNYGAIAEFLFQGIVTSLVLGPTAAGVHFTDTVDTVNQINVYVTGGNVVAQNKTGNPIALKWSVQQIS